MVTPASRLSEVQQNLLDVILGIQRLLKEDQTWTGKMGLGVSHKFLDSEGKNCGGAVEIISTADLVHSLSLGCSECHKKFQVDLKEIGLEEILGASSR